MGFAEDLLVILTSYHEGYRLMRKRMRGYTGPAKFSRIKQCLDADENTLRVTLSRLKKNGLAEHSHGVWSGTKKGREYLKRYVARFRELAPALSERRRKGPMVVPSSPQNRNMIIAFDIPERERRKRNWLRSELAIHDFMQLQKSVWMGPAPLPADFIRLLNELHLLPHMKFFRASEYDIV
ncbi:MAG: hypothetical protein Q8Q41_05315 [bacterium]|nr:hypothetical protein [bacterium]